MTTDPVCGMEVDERKAQYSSRDQGESYFFCSERCKELNCSSRSRSGT